MPAFKRFTKSTGNVAVKPSRRPAPRWLADAERIAAENAARRMKQQRLNHASKTKDMIDNGSAP